VHAYRADGCLVRGPLLCWVLQPQKLWLGVWFGLWHWVLISLCVKGAHAHDVATVIDRSGVAVRAGTHCAMPLMQRFGVTSTCRASFALYNTMEEVDALADALSRAEAMFS